MEMRGIVRGLHRTVSRLIDRRLDVHDDTTNKMNIFNDVAFSFFFFI